VKIEITVHIDVFHLTRTQDTRSDDILDLYAQFVLKQGQIEIRSQSVELSPNQYRNTNVELIHRREVETLNQSIIVRCTMMIIVSCLR
jgi:hypothetical protein